MSSAPAVFLPGELIEQIFSWLPVKSLLRFKCLNKSFKTLISDSQFIQIHLKNSSQNPHIALMSRLIENNYSVIILPISRLIENNYTNLQHNIINYQLNDNNKWWLVGSCNGLLFLADIQRQQFCFWNPATRKRYEFIVDDLENYFDFSFGYDSLNETYKVVAFRVEHGNAKSVKVLSMGDKSWRNIQCLPEFPRFYGPGKNNGVYLRNTINWLASITVQQYVVVSLDLSTESYTQLLLPRGFDEVSHVEPRIVVLMDSLCFSHDFKGTHFVIWQMKDFGVQKSWIQFLKISYHIYHSKLLSKFPMMDFYPLYLSDNSDTLILANDGDETCFIYNCKDNRGEQIRITRKIWWWSAKDYVESLVSTP